MRHFLAVPIFLFLSLSCVTPQSQEDIDTLMGDPNDTDHTIADNRQEDIDSTLDHRPIGQQKADARCQTINGQLPLYLPELEVVITQVFSGCITPEGEPGILPESQYTVGRIPCTESGGQIKYYGKVAKPKYIELRLPNSCPKRYKNDGELRKAINQQMDWPTSVKVAGISPIVPKFWAIPDLAFGQESRHLEIRNRSNIQTFKDHNRQKKSIRFQILGLENSWAPGRPLLDIMGQLELFGGNEFTLFIDSVSPVEPSSLQAITNVCKDLSRGSRCQFKSRY